MSLIAIAVIGGTGALVIVNKISEHSLYFLNKFFAPGNAEGENYSALFSYASQITHHRNFQVSLFVLVSGILVLFLGGILYAWSRDRDRYLNSR